jgi:hypothetical protein
MFQERTFLVPTCPQKFQDLLLYRHLWRNILFFKLSHNKVRYWRSSVSCLWLPPRSSTYSKKYDLCPPSSTFSVQRHFCVIKNSTKSGVFWAGFWARSFGGKKQPDKNGPKNTLCNAKNRQHWWVCKWDSSLGGENRHTSQVPLKHLLKCSFSEIPTISLTPYREFEQHPHKPHRRQLIFKFSV